MKKVPTAMVIFMAMLLSPLFSYAQSECFHDGNIPNDYRGYISKMGPVYVSIHGVVTDHLNAEQRSQATEACKEWSQLRGPTQRAKGQEIYNMLKQFLSWGQVPKALAVYSTITARGFDYNARSNAPIVVITYDVAGNGSAVLAQRFNACSRLTGQGAAPIRTTLLLQAPQAKSLDYSTLLANEKICGR